MGYQTRRRFVGRIVFDAMMVAVYFVFATMLTFKTPIFEVSMVGVPILLSAKLFGLSDALVVATIGSFLEQALGAYGVTVTTPLWMAPLMIMALFSGVLFKLTKESNNLIVFFAIIVFSELLLTVCNTAALYLDGAIMNYPVKALNVLAVPRLINGTVRTVISCILLPTLIVPLRKVLKK